MTTSTGAIRLARDVVLVVGSDAAAFLQGQLSQDVAALEVGGSAFSFVLQPQGKVEAFLRVTRTADDQFALDVDAGWGDAVVARLRRFLLRTKAEITVVDWDVVAVRGDGVVVEAPPGAWAVLPETPGVAGVDLLGPTVELPAGVGAIDPADYEALRISTGVPRMGAELDESTIPAAAGVVDRSVSFTKGCYTGQELVARIDSRGDRVPARLRGVVGQAALTVGDPVVVDGAEVGRLTSVAGHIGLAYVKRAVEPPMPARAGDVDVDVLALPLIVVSGAPGGPGGPEGL